MGFLSGYLAVFYFVRGLNKFHQKRYQEAATIFEKVCKLDSKHKKIAVYHSYLGRSYFELGKYNDALHYLSLSHKDFRKKDLIAEDDYERGIILETIRAFSHVLHKLGDVDRSQEIANELESVKSINNKKNR